MGFSYEIKPRRPGAQYGYPFSHQATVSRIEILALSGSDKAIDPLLWELDDQVPLAALMTAANLGSAASASITAANLGSSSSTAAGLFWAGALRFMGIIPSWVAP